jgi:hypothetical protein
VHNMTNVSNELTTWKRIWLTFRQAGRRNSTKQLRVIGPSAENRTPDTVKTNGAGLTAGALAQRTRPDKAGWITLLLAGRGRGRDARTHAHTHTHHCSIVSSTLRFYVSSISTFLSLFSLSRIDPFLEQHASR